MGSRLRQASNAFFHSVERLAEIGPDGLCSFMQAANGANGRVFGGLDSAMAADVAAKEAIDNSAPTIAILLIVHGNVAGFREMF